MKRKIYVETSVISYLTARPSKTILGAAHQQITLAWWETRNQYELLVSERSCVSVALVTQMPPKSGWQC
jgi:hypothetical protein